MKSLFGEAEPVSYGSVADSDPEPSAPQDGHSDDHSKHHHHKVLVAQLSKSTSRRLSIKDLPADSNLEVEEIGFLPREYFDIEEPHFQTQGISMLTRYNVARFTVPHIFSFLGEISFAITSVSIILLTLLYFYSFMPSVMVQPDTCAAPVCSHNPKLCPNYEVCTPQPPDWTNQLSFALVVILTVEYFFRVLTVNAVPSRVAGLIQTPEYDNPKYVDITGGDPNFKFSFLVQIVSYMIRPLNVVDLLSFAPFFITYYGYLSQYHAVISALRLSRLIRLFGAIRLARLVRLEMLSKYVFEKEMKVLKNTVLNAGSTLFMLFFSFLLLFAIIGSLLHVVEQGEFKVTSDYPKGAYLRPDVSGESLEVSPISSPFVGWYWAVVTATTLGYGDIYPTSVLGRILAITCVLLGVVMLTLPVTVVGTHFGEEYTTVFGADDDAPIETSNTNTTSLKTSTSLASAMSEGSSRNVKFSFEMTKSDYLNRLEELQNEMRDVLQKLKNF